MKKTKNLITLCLSLLLVVVTLISCKNVTTYEVTFDNGTSTTKVEVKENELVKQPTNPTNDGYKFIGWYKDSEFKEVFDFSSEKVTGNITIYAKWDLYQISDLLNLNVPDRETTTENFIVKANVLNIDKPEFGAMNIKDDSGEIYVFDTRDANNVKYADMEDKPYQYDEVLIKDKVKNFAGTKEIHDGIILEFTHVDPEFDESEYEEMTIANARQAKKNKKIKVTGQVAQITYAFGMIPSGYILVDNEASIYVYDSQTASRVKVGNEITICATKDYYILETESASAKKFGYKGSNQLKDVFLVKLNNTTEELDLSSATETTIKNVMEIPNTDDFTNKVFKTNALVSRSEGADFINYYLYDLDGKTGSYVYTQTSGADFEWLNQYDGKICTVYFVVQNAKCTSTGVIKRFLPIKVEDNNFKFDESKTAEFVLDYYLDNQFSEKYASDPNLELITTVSNELLGFENAKVEYQANSSAITFIDGIMHVDPVKKGLVTITVTVNYKEITASRNYEVEVVDLDSYDVKTISSIIAGEYDTEVILRGVVSSALVNQTGFYLTDKTGIIAIRINQDSLNTLKLGDEVIIKGVFKEKGKDGAIGNQLHINDAEILFNLHGDKEYYNTSFVESSLTNLAEIGTSGKETAQGYTIKAQLVEPEGNKYSPYQLKSNEVAINLYEGSRAQYEWLKPYLNEELTYEVMLCNWNGKYNQLCVISVTTSDGTKIFNPLV